MDVCDEWQKEQKLARLLEEIGYKNYHILRLFFFSLLKFWAQLYVGWEDKIPEKDNRSLSV